MAASIAGAPARRWVSTHCAPTWSPTSRPRKESRQVGVLSSTRTAPRAATASGTKRWTRTGRALTPSSSEAAGAPSRVQSVRSGGASPSGFATTSDTRAGPAPDGKGTSKPARAPVTRNGNVRRRVKP